MIQYSPRNQSVPSVNLELDGFVASPHTHLLDCDCCVSCLRLWVGLTMTAATIQGLCSDRDSENGENCSLFDAAMNSWGVSILSQSKLCHQGGVSWYV